MSVATLNGWSLQLQHAPPNFPEFDISQELVVNLASDDPSEATVPATVTIPANQASTTFDITAVDDALLDGPQPVTITASAAGYVSGSSAGAGASGWKITSGGSTVKGLAINRFGKSGIELFLGGNNVIEGNVLGANPDGDTALANNVGIATIGSDFNTIGGTVPGSGNLISGNGLYGVRLLNSLATNSVIQGNLIGTDADGNNAVGNGNAGIFVSGAPGNTIGGVTTGAGNSADRRVLPGRCLGSSREDVFGIEQLRRSNHAHRHGARRWRGA